MKLSHVLYKVNDLDRAVSDWREKGFTVEYGRAKKPYNALIYFSEGAYLELFATSGMPTIMKWALRLVGHGKMTDRINHWESAEEGLIAVCLENYRADFSDEKSLLKQHQQTYFEVKSKRLDVHGRLLTFRCLFPHDENIPFLMTYFNVDPKPKNYVHPNGATAIKQVAFGTTEALMPLVQNLCDDDALQLFVGNGVKELMFTYESSCKSMGH